MSRELLHEPLEKKGQLIRNQKKKRGKRGTNGTESSDFIVRLSFWIEISSSLGSSHVKTGESIFEDLLETKELENGEIDRRVKSKSSLVWSKSGRELKKSGSEKREKGCEGGEIGAKNLLELGILG